MDSKEARKLKVGDRVRYGSDPEIIAFGTVIDVMGLGYLVRFDDGEEHQYSFTHSTSIHRAPARKAA